MSDTSSLSTTAELGEVEGPLRRSVNAASEVAGSIHDDATARSLGLRGGTVAGSIHLDLFPPLLLETFGPRWFERGSLSMYFRNPTVDREPVRAIVGRLANGADGQVPVRIEREDGMLVGEGTASVGESAAPSALRRRDLAQFSDGEYRILEGLRAGDRIGPVELTTDTRLQDSLLERELVTEPLDWYQGASPWGGPVLVPQVMVHHLYRPGSAFISRTVGDHGGGVGLFGAIELANVEGPLIGGQTYTISGQILALGQSPKTEYAWFETSARDGDRTVATMLMQLRFMKASSPLYREE